MASKEKGRCYNFFVKKGGPYEISEIIFPGKSGKRNFKEPLKVGSVTLKNRFAMAPMGPLGLADANGGWNQRGIDYYTERAKGGTGLIITGVTFF